jgi:hypothetical protein
VGNEGTRISVSLAFGAEPEEVATPRLRRSFSSLRASRFFFFFFFFFLAWRGSPPALLPLEELDELELELELDEEGDLALRPLRL